MIQSILSPAPSPSLFAGLDDRLRVCTELLIAGVAFQTDNRIWEVFSHDGEHIGTMSTYWVNTTTCAMKKLGWRSDCITAVAKGEKPSLTFGHGRMAQRIPAAEWDILMARRHRTFVTMH